MGKVKSVKECLILLVFIALIFLVRTSWGQLDPNRLIPSDEKFLMPIYDVQPDQMGNIWLATQNGLQKYDGYELTRFYPDQSDSLTTPEILTFSLFEEEDGTLWIGCLDFITAYHPETRSFTNFNFRELIDFPVWAQPSVFSILSDNRGRIYFGVNSNLGFPGKDALLYFDKADKKLHTYEVPAEDSIMNVNVMIADKYNNIWVNSWDGIIMIDTLDQFHRLLYPFDLIDGNYEEWISGLGYNSNGEILMVTNYAGLFIYEPGKKEYKEFQIPGIEVTPNNDFHAYSMLSDSLDNTWIASNYGLFYFDRANGLFETFTDREEMKDKIFGLKYDAFGDLWISSATQGLFRYSNKTLLNSFAYDISDKRSITGGWVYKMYENEDGTVWVLTRGNIEESGLNLFNPATNTIKPFPHSSFLPEVQRYEFITMIEPDEFLYDTDRGYVKCNPIKRTWEKMKLSGGAWDSAIYKILRDSRGNTCFGTSEGFYIEKADGTTKHYSLLDFPLTNPASNEVSLLVESIRDGVWIGSNAGLFFYHYSNDSIERHAYDPAKGDVLRSQDINSFYEDSEGIAWIGTWGGGLSKYDPETHKVINYSMNEGLPSMAIQGIIADEDRRVLWLSTFEGISMFDIKSGSFKNFSLEDGIQATLYADGAYLKTKSGVAIFGANNGISYFDVAEVSKKSHPPLVFINDFKVEKKSYANYLDSPFKSGTGEKNDLELNYDQNTISIDYTAIHYANPSKNQFAYKLEGYDDSWREVNNIRSAYYYNLPFGKYTFQLKAANSNGVWSEHAVSFNFKIKRPWWRTWLAYTAYGIIFILLLFLMDRYQKKRLMERQKRLTKEKELAQAKEIEKAYTELKNTQKQLLHSEKMASLGELTAGIAHEIQNPLNFVNNFSELNAELIDEVNEELDHGHFAEVTEILQNIKENEQKIGHHGKRAESIVKGMLMHSRGNTGEKELTDLNLLCDEYLRLSYHGFRAKDKSFNAEFKLDTEESLPKVKVVPQDIGRVILNLINNAFYAVSEKLKNGMPDFKPMVSVQLSNIKDRIQIRITDNGSGIPEGIKEKIFQPFYTSKPTGEGTGLGLSLSYDIITKGHGGELSFESTEGEGTEFIILLPINTE